MASARHRQLQPPGRALSEATDLFAGVLPFVATAELGSFRAAARKLGVTPSAVSKAIVRLEAQLGTRLLHRTSRAVSLTPEGSVFLSGCAAAIEHLQSARAELAQVQREPRGRLRVSLPLMLGRTLLPKLSRWLERHPQLSLDAVITDRQVDFAKEAFDASLRLGAVTTPRAVVRKLRTVAWVTVAAPSYLARHGAPSSPEELAHHNCLAFITEAGTAKPWEFRAPTPPHAFIPWRPRGNLRADHGEALIDAALAGAGLFQAHDYAVADALESGELIELLPQHRAPGPVLSLIYAPGRNSSAKVRAFGDAVIAASSPALRSTIEGGARRARRGR